jgi:hypothetical protein
MNLEMPPVTGDQFNIRIILVVSRGPLDFGFGLGNLGSGLERLGSGG